MVKTNDKDDLEKIGARIVETLNEQVFDVDGAPQCIVQREDGEYRKKHIMAGWQFFLTDCYVGQRGSLIFQFTPVDKHDFQLIEVQMNEIDTVFPLLGPTLKDLSKSAEILGENFKLLTATTERFKDVFEVFRVAEMKIRADEADKAAQVYANNAKFGMF